MSAFVPVERLAVVGLGLLGGSVALAARERGVARHCVGIGRRREPLEAARARGVVDEVSTDLRAVAGADFVVLGTPVETMPAVLREAAPHLADGALVTDVGSVKGVLADTLPGLLPPGTRYVGAHPMAGSHLRGSEHARGDLFERAACVVTARPDDDPAAVARVEGFWKALGARVVRRDPATHDAEVAWASHAPHVVAWAYAGALEAAPPDAADVAGSGFRDFMRIARSDPELWGDILCANRKAVAAPLQETADRLAALARCIEANDVDALERRLASARDALARLTRGTEPRPGAGPARTREGTNRERAGRPTAAADSGERNRS